MNKAKENKRGQNAVYTANDCFSDGLDNMEQGKCYALNTDRDTQYGWINNNAQDRWWWKEVACGGESGDSNGCPENISPLFKKSIFNDSSDDSDKNVSYEIWGNKTQFFYDALGRKTQARPETRRYLFEKKKAFNKEQNYWLSGSTSFLLRAGLNGFIDAWSYGRIIIQNMDSSSISPTSYYINVLLILKTEIKDSVDLGVPDLVYHEKKHIEIYEDLGNKQWNIKVPINICSSVKEQCSKIEETALQEIEQQIRLMIRAQNKWDDDDDNNISSHRIDEESKVQELRLDIKNHYECGLSNK